MRFKSLITLILTVCLAVITSSAMAKSDKSGKSDKSDKSAKSAKSAKSDKSAKSRKSGKRGHGHGHCKSDKSGKGHKKKRGKGHDRDCDDDEPPVEPPVVLTCTAGVSEFIDDAEFFDDRGTFFLGIFTTSITNSGRICAIGDEDVYENTVTVDSGATTCDFDAGASSVSAYMTSETEFWYDMTSVRTCGPVAGGPY